MHRPLAFLTLLVLRSVAALAASPPDPALLARAATFEPIFYAPATSTVALSPDGTKVAFDLRRGGTLSIITLDLEKPTQPIADIAVGASRLVKHDGEVFERLAWVTALQWIDDQRLVVAPVVPDASGRPSTSVFTVNADGGSPVTLLEDSGPRTHYRIAGFLPDPSPRLIVDGGLNPSSRRVIDLISGRSKNMNNPRKDAYTALSEELQSALRQVPPEAELDFDFLRKTFPDSTLTLYATRGSSPRRAAMIERPDRPGRFIVFERETRRIWNLAGQAPPASVRRIEHHAFDFEQDGETYRGFVATPVYSATERAPVIFFMPRENYDPHFVRYDPKITAFNAMGFAVVVLQPRGSDAPCTTFYSGGVPFPPDESTLPPRTPSSIEDMKERSRLQQNPPLEHVRVQLEHQLRAVDVLADRFALSRRAVAIYADGFQTQRALLLNALAPGRFRCLVFEGVGRDRTDWTGEPEWLNVIPASDTDIGATALLIFSDQNPLIRDHIKRIATKLESGGIRSYAMPTSPGQLQPNHPAGYALTIARIERFLNENLYAYATEIGELNVMPDAHTPVSH